MSTNTTIQCLSVLQRPSSASDTASLRVQKSIKPFFHCGGKKNPKQHIFCCSTISSAVCEHFLLLQRFCAKGNENTSAQADDSPQALPSPHDDGGQDLAPQKAVLDACGQGVEALVTQHRYLVVQSAATHWKLEGRMYIG